MTGRSRSSRRAGARRDTLPGIATWSTNPEVTIEHAGETFRARARTVDEPERTRLFDLQAAEMPFFDGYRKRVKAREIPVVAFERID